ncbi:MAG: DUF302 domain-containing protein [Desulfobacterales bacterium]
MALVSVLHKESDKSVAAFVASLQTAAVESGFIVNNPGSMDMAGAFADHGLSVEAGFDLYMIQICKPDKAARSLARNPERAVLMPKFVMAFSKGGKTQVRFLRYSREMIEGVVDDPEFAGSLEQSYQAISGMIAAAL